MRGPKELVQVCSSCTDPVHVTVCQQVGTAGLDSKYSTYAELSVVGDSGIIPANARGVTIFNDTAAAIAFNVSAGAAGTHVIPPRATHSITLPDAASPFAGTWLITTVQGDSGPIRNQINPATYVNWVIFNP